MNWKMPMESHLQHNQDAELILGATRPASHTAAPVRSDTVTTRRTTDETALQEASSNSVLQRRTLKIETVGDFAAGKIKPLIRLTGHWLERAGFKPGDRVEVSHSKDGQLLLQAKETRPEHQNEER